MVLLKHAFLALALINLTISTYGSKGFKNKIVSVRPHPDKSEPGTMPVTEGIENTTAWFVYCNNNTMMETDARCSLYVQDYEFNSTSRLQKCNFIIVPSFKGSVSVLPWLRAFRMSDKKFLLTWIEYNPNMTIHVQHVDDEKLRVGTFVKFLIIHMENCVTRTFRTTGTTYNDTHFDIHGLMQNVDLRINERTFDVFYPYFENSKWAQERFNTEGRRIKGPLGAKDFELDDRAVKVNMYPNHTKLDIRSWERFNAQDVCWKEMPCQLPLGVEDGYGLSTSRDAYTSCKKTSAKTWQCQSQGLLTQAIGEMTLAFNYEPKHFMIYNVWIDPLVVMTSRLESDGNSHAILITIFGPDGSPYKPVLFARIHRPILMLHGHFFVNDDLDICFSMLAILHDHETDFESYFNFVSKCYPKDTLTKKL